MNPEQMYDEITSLEKAIIVHSSLTEELPYNPAIRGNLPPRGPPIPEADFQEGAEKLAEILVGGEELN